MDGFTSIKVKKSVANKLKQDHIKSGSYGSTIESLIENQPFTVSESTVAALAKKFDVSVDNLDAFIKSYLVESHQERVDALGADGKEVFEVTKDLEAAEETDKFCKVIIKDGKVDLPMLGALVQKLYVDLTLLKKEIQNG